MSESDAVPPSLYDQARTALDAKRGAERDLAAAVTCPPWRHALFGVLMGSLIATSAFSPSVRWTVYAGILCGVALIVRTDRRRLGVFVNGYRRGRTRIVAVAVVAVELALYAIGFARGHDGDRFTPVVLAVLGVGIGTAGSVMWQRAFRRELGA